MSRNSAATDFHIEIEGVGMFAFGRRMLRDEMRIAAEYSRLTEGVETPTQWLEFVATWVSTLKVLTVSAPDGWDIEQMDPLDQETYSKLRQVHMALREKEQSFRSGKSAAGAQYGQGNIAEPGVLVPPEVQPGAD